MKFIILSIFVLNGLMLNAQVQISWAKKTFTEDGFSYSVSFPQVSACKAKSKINAFFVKNCKMWSTHDYENEGESVFAKITVEKNVNGLLILKLNNGFENAEKAREREYFIKFNTKTGKNEIMNSDNISDDWLERGL